MQAFEDLRGFDVFEMRELLECLGFVFGVLLLIFNVANLGDLFSKTDVKWLAGLLYFSALMSIFALGMVSSAVLNSDDQV